MTRRPIEVLIHHMPTVAARAENEWARGFALSFLRQAQRRNWKPSPKQDEIAQRLVAELFAETGDGDFDVIEDEA